MTEHYTNTYRVRCIQRQRRKDIHSKRDKQKYRAYRAAQGNTWKRMANINIHTEIHTQTERKDILAGCQTGRQPETNRDSQHQNRTEANTDADTDKGRYTQGNSRHTYVGTGTDNQQEGHTGGHIHTPHIYIHAYTHTHIHTY